MLETVAFLGVGTNQALVDMLAFLEPCRMARIAAFLALHTDSSFLSRSVSWAPYSYAVAAREAGGVTLAVVEVRSSCPLSKRPSVRMGCLASSEVRKDWAKHS